METLLAYTVGVMVAVAIYQLLSRNLLRLLFGFILFGNAVNLTIFTAGRLTPGLPPLIDEGAEVLAGATANPLPQALILTAIVIGFGLVTFAFVLVYRGYVNLGSTDSDALRIAEPRRLYAGEPVPPTLTADKDEATGQPAAERTHA